MHILMRRPARIMLTSYFLIRLRPEKKFLEIHSLVQYLINLGRTVREADYVYYIPPSVSDEEEENKKEDGMLPRILL